MKFSLTTLKQYLDTSATVAEIADKLTMIGLEVEEVQDLAANLKGYIVGEIRVVEQHPNADKLHVLRVFNGKEDVQIVCGAPNVRVGLKSILAQPGCYVPLFKETIQISKLRGVESNGMMCAEDELGVGTDHQGIIELNADIPAGTPAAEALNADVIFDVNVTPNRPDCLGVKGIARDLAATGIGTLKEESVSEIPGTFSSPISVSIQDKTCPIYTGRFIRGVKNGDSPDWMKKALIAAGLRPISALVDITNYLNIAECRPLHVFDADKLTGNITVRPAQEGEKMMALDDKEYTLSPAVCVIADDKSAQSIAGVMGGVDTCVSRETTNVFLESAYFEPVAIAKAGVLTGAMSDSRSRFERGIDPASSISDNVRATRMILDICGGEASEIVIAGQEPDCHRVIDFDFAEVKRLTGLDIPQPKMEEILKTLGFGVNGSQISVPSWRIHDISLPADLVEEIVRIYGLDSLPDAPMRADVLPTGTLLPHQKREVAVRRALAARGLCQAITWSFMDSKLAKYFGSKGIRIANPIASDLDEMRPSLVPNLLSAVKRNQDHGTPDVQLFEVGPAFYSDKPGEQRLVACGVRAGAWTPKHWLQPSRNVDVFDAKADALTALAAVDAPVNTQIFRNAPVWYHPGRSGSIQLGKNILAVFGEIHPAVLKAFDIKTPVCAFEVYMDAVPAGKVKGKIQKEFTASAFLPLTRDFAFVMDQSVEAAKVIGTIQNVNKELITGVSVFDVYQGEHLPAGKKSLAVQVTIQPREKTLTDTEIETLSTQIVNFVTKNTGAVLRS
ncbi:MAG: phenylalanine--tRNA ligase subunit beta [Alphaproteobacteria bacterium]|nr:phenylalanine--tRNA ligase subunit beta [Alphaproteobacteria bacterium]